MSEILAKAPVNEQSWLLADWFEFQVLISEFNYTPLNRLPRIVDEDQDFENPDFVAQDTDEEQILESLINELKLRIDCLQDAYPFYLNPQGTELKLKEEITPGGYSYLYCLFFSHVNRNEVLIIDPPSKNEDRDLMQICSTLAAAANVQGSAVSFGFPRQDRTNFLAALKKTYRLMGEGSVVDKIPPGAPGYEKDGGIDVIAWGVTTDNNAGKNYLLGQVATGANWEDKSVKQYIAPFHDTWFTLKPASTPRPAMYIPFCIDLKLTESLNDILHYKTYIFGEIYYRYRLPLYVDEGYKLATENKDLNIDRFDDFAKVRDYVKNFCHTISQ